MSMYNSYEQTVKYVAQIRSLPATRTIPDRFETTFIILIEPFSSYLATL